MIAEAGANHNRDLGIAKQLIDVASEAGADAVKFQTYSGARIYSRKTPRFTYLEGIINSRKSGNDEGSYIKKLSAKGINKISQKVGEEAVEMVIEAKDDNDELFLGEAADLLFHYLLLLNAKGHNLQKVIGVLQDRHKK